MFMDPIAAFVYSNSSVLVDKYNPLGTILVSLSEVKSDYRMTRTALHAQSQRKTVAKDGGRVTEVQLGLCLQY